MGIFVHILSSSVFVVKKSGYHSNKSGFTLVELVVVIAILAILAAIAIPAIVGIIDNATMASDETASNDIDHACMEYKTAIIWGIVNSSEKGNSSQADLPYENASFAQKLSSAKSATVKNALEFAGITKYEDRVDKGSFVYDNEGRVHPQIQKPAGKLLKLTTRLGVLYYGENDTE